MTHLTEKECQTFLSNKCLEEDIRTSANDNGKELLGKEVVAIYFNGGLHGHSFVVKDLENGEFGEEDGESIYTITWAYMVVLKVTFDERIEKIKLKEFKEKAIQFKDAFNSLVDAWNDLPNGYSDAVNELNSYPFQSSLDEYQVNNWVDTIEYLIN